MNKKNLIISLFLLTLFLLSLSTVLATTTVSTSNPGTNNENLTGTVILRATTNQSAQSVTFWYRDGTSGAYTNLSANKTAGTTFSYSFDTTTQSETKVGQIIFNPDFGVGQNESNATRTGLLIENSNPTVNFQLEKTIHTSLKAFVADCSRSSHTVSSLNITLYVISPDSTVVTSTVANYTTFDGTNFQQKGVYTMRCGASDTTYGYASQDITLTVKG